MLDAGIFGAQCRAARAMLGWSQDDLADRAGVHRNTLRKFEGETAIPHANHLVAIRSSLEGQGFRFICDEATGELGLFFRRPVV